MIPPLYPGLFAPVQLALESWVHLSTVKKQKLLGEKKPQKTIFVQFFELHYIKGYPLHRFATLIC